MSKDTKEYNEDIGCNMVENIIYIFESKGASGAIGAIEKYIRLGDVGKAPKICFWDNKEHLKTH
jgi:hypothetical protein